MAEQHVRTDTTVADTRTELAPIRSVLVGVGNRGRVYGRFAETEPAAMSVTVIVERDPDRRTAAAARHEVPPEQQYGSVEELPSAGAVADVAICATMDADHVQVATILLRKGYHVLLEKPVAQSADDLLLLEREAAAAGTILMVCHVLRYAPFYVEINDRVRSGAIGELVSVHMTEQVRYGHMATAFVRGPWRNADATGSGMLLAKCCHDLDLMSWLAAPHRPVRVTSAGGLAYFDRAHAPAGAGTRCLGDCQIEASCAYSAKRLYVDLDLYGKHAWSELPEEDKDSRSARIASLRGDNPYGGCVWRSDNTVVDRQVVSVEFDNGAVGSFVLAGTGCGPARTIMLVGTEGTIEGSLDTGTFTVRTVATSGDTATNTEHVDVGVAHRVHGGGDMPLVADFIDAVRGETTSPSRTSLDDSINGHLVVFAAEQARSEHRWVGLDEFRATTP